MVNHFPHELPWSVAVFAHNEEANIIECLESIVKGSTEYPIQTYVLANGCSDRTEMLVQNFAKTHPQVTLVSITLGDKANAWNVFVHEIVPQSLVCFFVDGDVQVCPGAFDMLFSVLVARSEANGAAAIPFSGRSRKWLEEVVCKRHLLLGGLYALRGEFVQSIKCQRVLLPIGFIGEDGLITSLVKWGLDPTGPFLDERVAPCPAAGFTYRSFSLYKVQDWKTYWYRRVRYSIRHFQHELLVPVLKKDGIRGMPMTVDDLYRLQWEILKKCRPRNGWDIFFDLIAIRRILRRCSD